MGLLEFLKGKPKEDPKIRELEEKINNIYKVTALAIQNYENIKLIRRENTEIKNNLYILASNIEEDLEKVQRKIENLGKKGIEESVVQTTQTQKEIPKKVRQQKEDVQAQTARRPNHLNEQIQNLTKNEKDIINILLDSEIPLSNSEIGEKLNKSESTIRSQINSIGKKTDILEVKVIDKNKKLYRISPKIKAEILS